MIGFRGASRYVSDSFRQCFELECEAISGCARTWAHQRRDHDPVHAHGGRGGGGIQLLADNGLKRGENGLG